MTVEPSLLKLNGEEETMRRTAKKNNEIRLDLSARGFWVNGYAAYFDVSVFTLTLEIIRTNPLNNVAL